MTGGDCAIRGTFFDLLDDPWKHVGREHEASRFIPDGLMVVENGIIKDFGSYADVAPRYPGVNVTAIKNRIILPGFIDAHIHFPQVRVLGAYGLQLLDWLTTWVFPEERKYSDYAYARDGARHFFDAMLASGTTTCQAFTTSNAVSTYVFFEEATHRNLRVISGLTGMDRFGPPEVLDNAENFYRDSKRLIERYHRKGRNLYAITPRFALGCSREMLQRCRQLKQEHEDCWINTHISEVPGELRWAREQFPECPDYTGVHEKYCLLGPKFSGGHGVWLSDEEFRRFAHAGAAVVFCPLSNLFLGSGLFRLGRATDPAHRVRLAVGSDIGAGNAFSLLRVLEEAYKIGMCNKATLEESRNANDVIRAEAERNVLSSYRAFYLATLGAAHALYLDDLLGNFEKGKEADFVVVDWNAGPVAMEWHQELANSGGSPETVEQAAQLLFAVMAVGDDRSIDQTWVAGQQAYQRA